MKLTPEQFAKSERLRLVNVLLDRISRHANERGISANYDGEVIRVNLKDANRLRLYLKAAGFQSSWIEHEIEAFQKGEADFYLSESERYYQRVAADVIARFMPALSLRLRKVPIFIGADTYFDGWAKPVGEGDVISVNSGIDSLRIWMAMHWLAMERYEHKVADQPPMAVFAVMPWFSKQALGIQRDDAALTCPGVPGWVRESIREIALDAQSDNHARVKIAEYFIMAHELAHVALGHTDQIRGWPDHPKDESEEEKRCSAMRQFEYDADMFAIKSLLPLAKNPDNAREFLDPLLSVFLMLHVANPQTSVQRFATHPLPTDRCQRLYLRCCPTGEEPNAAELIINLSNHMLRAMQQRNNMLSSGDKIPGWLI